MQEKFIFCEACTCSECIIGTDRTCRYKIADLWYCNICTNGMLYDSYQSIDEWKKMVSDAGFKKSICKSCERYYFEKNQTI